MRCREQGVQFVRRNRDFIQTRYDFDGVAVPEHIQDFVASHTGRQLALRLV
jgi:hypothetical protein